MTTINKLFESEFPSILLLKAGEISNKWSSLISEKLDKNRSYSEPFESVGTKEEIEIYNKAQKFIAMQNAVEDIDIVFTFLQVDRNKILELHPNLNTQENYYKYHFENFIIRTYTIIDSLGKLGDSLYKTEIKDCNCYKLKEKIKNEYPEIALSLENILTYSDENKTRRHTKIHSGEIEISEVRNIPFWEDYADVLPEIFDLKNPILLSMTNEKIEQMIAELKSYVVGLIEKINVFLDKSIDKI
ncbi:Cthe_2314 family HEPN domain-containing protein [Flavobacterium sp. GT3R68]|uniref:Cthe_2314 family HEPN domain-containing protein n=1 Tax=Flavobacterium sp. GT3R68 TaxID=2594437 RepID=UPI000F870544|nr:Cthe_2314 family HEPN domain-containing protein [Flavobacterium sp. GT3R68]RTY85830.1 hypothetical protein EKL32_28325 [Flavobacterium sp. GSN2]TRW89349.1 hypothetical protein FNW07_13490 [Flavobacterium sp. GT3R68]